MVLPRLFVPRLSMMANVSWIEKCELKSDKIFHKYIPSGTEVLEG